MVCIDSFKLQTMTAFYQKFLQGGPDATRGQFFQKAPPLAAGGKKTGDLTFFGDLLYYKT